MRWVGPFKWDGDDGDEGHVGLTATQQTTQQMVHKIPSDCSSLQQDAGQWAIGPSTGVVDCAERYAG